jgi:hypothetical protein
MVIFYALFASFFIKLNSSLKLNIIVENFKDSVIKSLAKRKNFHKK